MFLEELPPAFTARPQNNLGQTKVNRDLPRSIISRDARSVDRLLSVLSLGGPAAAAAWRFLMRLPTNPDMLSAVRSLEGVRPDCGGSSACGDDGERRLREGAKWKTLLGPPGSHRMLYTLQIVEGVLEYVSGCCGGGTVERPKGGEEASSLAGIERRVNAKEWEVC